jgi:serine/threonine protein kinase/WD40 repeat protein
MTSNSSCPAPEVLQRFPQGLLSDTQEQLLVQHLEGCAACLKKLQALLAQDPLPELLQTPPPALEKYDEKELDVNKLIRTVIALGSAPPSEGGTPSARKQEAGPAEQSSSPLGPPKHPGDLGQLGEYRILRHLDRGGMGAVYEGFDPRLDRPVAVKVLRRDRLVSETARQRFRREARIAACLEHDNVIRVYDVGEVDGVPFLVMELLRGQTLGQRLAQTRGPLSLPEILRLGTEIASGLIAAHERGLIHRDVKPDNIWLQAETDRVKILDFGLAREVQDEVGLTQEGAIAGTPYYMAPEQARGKEVDQRADLFSLGSVLYHLCTGKRPFSGSDAVEILHAVREAQPRPPSELNPKVPRCLSDLVLRLLAKSPADRPQSAREVIDGLKQCEEELPRIPGVPAKESAGRPESEHGVSPDPREDEEQPHVAEERPRGAAGVAVVVAVSILLVAGGLLGPGLLRKICNPNGLSPVPAGDTAVPPRLQVIQNPALPDQGPLYPSALVRQAAPVPGVRNWTIETRGHRGEVWALAFRPDGRLLAAGGEDGVVRLWHVDDGRLVRLLIVPKRPVVEPVRTLTWSPDGKVLAAGGKFGICLWDAESGVASQILSEGRTVHRLLWSPDGKRLVDCSGGVIWDVGTSEPAGFLKVPRDPLLVTWAGWSPDGAYLALVTREPGHEVLLFRAGGGEPRRIPDCKDLSAWCGAWSPDGKILAVGGDKTVWLWGVQSKDDPRTLEGGSGLLAWYRDGDVLADLSGGTLWDVRTRARHAGRPDPAKLDAARATGKADHDSVLSGERPDLALSRDGKMMARVVLPEAAVSGGPGVCAVQLRAVSDDGLLRTISGQPLLLGPRVGGEKRYGVAWGKDGRLSLLNTEPGGVSQKPPLREQECDFSPDRRYRACRLIDGLLVEEDPGGQPQGCLLGLRDGSWLTVSREGHYCLTGEQAKNAPAPDAAELVYVVWTNEGLKLASPDTFAKVYGWRNSAKTVRLTGTMD